VIGDFVLELVNAPGTSTVTLPGASPSARLTWVSKFGAIRTPCFYIMDDTVGNVEWGVGTYLPGSPAQVSRDRVLGNSQGTQPAPLNFTNNNVAIFPMWPSQHQLPMLGNNVGRNVLHNPLFRIVQRGTGLGSSFTTLGYSADRWLIQAAGGTGRTVQSVGWGDPGRTQTLDEDADYGIRYTFTGTNGAGDFEWFGQRVENLRRFSGKLLTMSCWLRTAGANFPRIAMAVQPSYGSGGSPSPAGFAFAGITPPIQSVFNRYAFTVLVPTSIGKTFGTTAGTDFLQVGWWLSAGSVNSANLGGIGVQSGVVDFWGMQAEIGPAPTPLEKPDPQVDMNRCQRFACKLNLTAQSPAVGFMMTPFPFPQVMRATPSITNITAGTGSNASGPTEVAQDNTAGRFQINASAASGSWSGRVSLYSADL